MRALASPISALLQAVADSAGTRFVLEHSWLDTLASVAQSLVSVLVLVMLVMGVLLLYALRRSIEELTRLIRSSYDPLKSAIKDVRDVAADVRSMVRTVQEPVALAGAAIEEAGDRVRAAMGHAEDRLSRLEALVDLAQGEMEGAVVQAASLLRGVRVGGRAVGRVFGLSRATSSGRRKRRAARDATRSSRKEARAESPPPDDETESGATGHREAPRIKRRGAIAQ